MLMPVARWRLAAGPLVMQTIAPVCHNSRCEFLRSDAAFDLSIARLVNWMFFSIDEITNLSRQMGSLLLAIAMDSRTICPLPSRLVTSLIDAMCSFPSRTPYEVSQE